MPSFWGNMSDPAKTLVVCGTCVFLILIFVLVSLWKQPGKTFKYNAIPSFTVRVVFEHIAESASYQGKLSITPRETSSGWVVRLERNDHNLSAVLTVEDAIAYHRSLGEIIEYIQWRRDSEIPPE